LDNLEKDIPSVHSYVSEADGTRRGGFFERTASGDESIALGGWIYLELEKRLEL
jgi:hypothetical protein